MQLWKKGSKQVAKKDSNNTSNRGIGREEGQLETLNKLIKKGKLSIEDAADSANMTVEDLLKKNNAFNK